MAYLCCQQEVSYCNPTSRTLGFKSAPTLGSCHQQAQHTEWGRAGEEPLVARPCPKTAEKASPLWRPLGTACCFKARGPLGWRCPHFSAAALDSECQPPGPVEARLNSPQPREDRTSQITWTGIYFRSFNHGQDHQQMR